MAEHGDECAASAVFDEVAHIAIATQCADTADRIKSLLTGRFSIKHVEFRDGCLLPVEQFDVVLIDCTSVGSGEQYLTTLRQALGALERPVLALIDATSPEAGAVCIEAGADDFISSPVRASDLIARICVLMRRRRLSLSKPSADRDDFVLDSENQCVWRRGRATSLGPIKFQILMAFIENTGKPLNRHLIKQTVWGEGSCVDERTIDVHVGRLRRLLRRGGRTPIKTLRGRGYIFDPR